MPSQNALAADLLAGLRAVQDRNDPVRLATRAGIVLDDWQREVMDSTAQTLLINCSRQAGKSTICGLVIARELVRPDRTVVITSPTERQSKELMRKVLAFWRRIGKPVPHVSIGKTEMELRNGSRLLALPGNADGVRGFTVDLLVPDEAAMCSEELYTAISPMLTVSKGRMIAPSTPKGKRGWWYNLWLLSDPGDPNRDPDIHRIEVPATRIPRISPQFLARELRLRGQTYVDQEYLCKFVDNERMAFREEDVRAIFAEPVKTDAELFAGIGA